MNRFLKISAVVLAFFSVAAFASVTMRDLIITASTFTNGAITNSTINSTSVGLTTPSTGAFTTVTANGLTNGKCVQASTGGLLATTAFPCRSGIDLDWTDTGCALANSTDATCATSTTLPSGGYADSSYSVECTPENSSPGSGGTTIPVVVFTTQTKTATALSYQLSCTFGCSSVASVTTTIDCHAHHN